MENMNENHSNTTSIFRQNEDDVPVDNFQVENMRQKLKRAKKDNVRKSKNYKKIETFDTLTNDDQPSTTEPLREGFERDEYEGYDDVDETPSKPINLKIGEGIEYVYNKITSTNTYLATTFASALSGGRQTPEDVSTVKDYLITLESVLVASYIVYNWYFLMYYAKDNAIDIKHISLADLKSSDNAIITFFLFFFEYAIAIIETLDNILLKHIPDKIGYYMNGATRITLLFVCLIYFVKYFASGFKNFLINSLNFDLKGSGIAIMLTYVIFKFFYTLVDDCIQSSIDPTRSKPLVMRAFEKGLIASPFVIIGLLFYYIMRLLIIIYISLPIGCILTGFYLLFYSFFGRTYYSSSTTYDDLDRHATGESPIKHNDCDDGLMTGWLKTIMLFIFSIFDGIKSYSFLLVLLMIVMSMSSSMYSNLSDARSFIPGILFRDIIGMYNGIAIVIIISIIYAKWSNKFTNE